jgi:hypothetical protein
LGLGGVLESKGMKRGKAAKGRNNTEKGGGKRKIRKRETQRGEVAEWKE